MMSAFLISAVDPYGGRYKPEGMETTALRPLSADAAAMRRTLLKNQGTMDRMLRARGMWRRWLGLAVAAAFTLGFCVGALLP